jgi:hypothetical protein
MTGDIAITRNNLFVSRIRRRDEHTAILCAALGSAKLKDLDRPSRVADVIDRMA